MSYLDRFCPECDTPIDSEKDTFVTHLKEDHNPGTPGIPPELIAVDTYRCPNCDYSPTDELKD